MPFHGCKSLENVIIDADISSIYRETFYPCENLTSVTLPSNITEIKEFAFLGCDNISDVYFKGNENMWKNIKIGEYNSSLLKSTIHFIECKHIYDEWKVVSHPTCTNKGIENHVCSKCNYVEIRETPARAHEYNFAIILPTCIDRGYTTYTCSSCGDTYTGDYVDALGHTDGDVVEENYVAPTCTANGGKENVTYCTICNAETSREIITIPSVGHTEVEIPAVAPTCTETGLTTGVKCSVCDEVLEPQQEVPALGHDIVIDEAVSPDCTSTGLTAGEHCSRCDYKVEQTVVDALGHKYDSVITAPTCTSQCYTKYTCHCGDTYTGDYVDSLAHNYKDGICIDCETPDPSYFTFEIQQPSRTTIRCNDGIKLHTKITGKLPDGTKIEWSKNNNNFNMTTSASGNEITIISKNNGYTTFTATVYDADNNVIAQDTIEMYSKAGLFDKIGGFFRSLFGTTKIYDN